MVGHPTCHNARLTALTHCFCGVNVVVPPALALSLQYLIIHHLLEAFQLGLWAKIDDFYSSLL